MIRFDTSQVERNLKALTPSIRRAASQAIRTEQLRVFRKSQQEVPVDTGRLRQSGETPPPTHAGDVVEAIVRYTEVYALSVHENPRSGRTGGRSPQGRRYKTWAEHGKWKYLQEPLFANERGMLRRMARHINSAI